MSIRIGGWLVENRVFFCAGALAASACALDVAGPDGGQGGSAGSASGQGGLGGTAPTGGKAGVGGSANNTGGSAGNGGSAATTGGSANTTGGSAGSSEGGEAGDVGAAGSGGSSGSTTDAGAGGEGGTPEPEGACATNPCENGGSCEEVGDGFECECADGYDGTRCEDNIDDCIGVTCENGGRCVDGVATHTCECTDRYAGPACEFLEIKLVPTDFYLGDESQVTALSNDGTVALLNVTGGGAGWVAKLVDFETTVAVEVNGLAANGRWAFGISADGGVLAGQVLRGGPTYVPFQLVGTTSSLLDLTPLPAPASGSNALDVSADGTTIVGVSNDSNTGNLEAFRYTAAGSQYVGDRLTGEGPLEAHAVSGDGSVVAGIALGANALPARAWRWSGGTTTSLELKSAAWTQPRVGDLSRNGQVVVGTVSISGVPHAVRWTGTSGTAEDLGTGDALGTNADGSVVVGNDNSGNAVVWTGTTKRTLASILGSNPDIVGTLTTAVGVSDDGRIVAGNLTANGKSQGFMARLR